MTSPAAVPAVVAFDHLHAVRAARAPEATETAALTALLAALEAANAARPESLRVSNADVVDVARAAWKATFFTAPRDEEFVRPMREAARNRVLRFATR